MIDIKSILKKKIKQLRLEAMITEDYISELSNKGFDWSQVDQLQHDTLIDLIADKVKQENERQSKNDK